MQVYSITKGFSTILYCRPDVVLSLQPMFPPKPLDTLPLEVDAQKV